MSESANHFLIGGGIASLSAAVLLIREAGVAGHAICVIEHLDRLGGSLDGAGSMQEGFSTRGGRMFEENFVCTFDLFDTIPTIDDPDRSVTADIRCFNREVISDADCRLVRAGHKAKDRHRLLLSWPDRAALLRLNAASEASLGDRTIQSWFPHNFFESNFWLLWASMFSFTPAHSLVEMRRYMRRFIHFFPGLTRLSGIMRTRLNQYDSLICPLRDWLTEQGVRFWTGTTVSDVRIEGELNLRTVSAIILEDGTEIPLSRNDRVYITLGSMTDASSLGSNDAAPPRKDEPGPAWKLWQKLAQQNDGLGRPEVFCGDPRKTAWNSFTVTLDDLAFERFMQEYSGRASGVGGLVTFVDSGWLMSIVVVHQPHFRNQPAGACTFWGYGLRSDGLGDTVPKPMWDATGEEILSELAWQLRLDDRQKSWFDAAKIVPCRMPFITSQFMPRRSGDRPPVKPLGAENFALMGQYCEIERDCVFTVEYSIRSAWEAIRSLNGNCRPPPPVVRTDLNALNLFRAAGRLLRN